MKRKLLLLLGIFLCAQHLAKAAHIIGGEISYRCFGEGNYQIIIKMYRDCYGGGAGFDSNGPDEAIGQVTIYRGDSPVPFRSIILSPPKVVNVDANLGSDCIGVPPDVCVEEGFYSFSTVLPRSEESYYISYQRCCRNNTITNIQQPGDTGATYTAEITPVAQSTCNNSPTFKDFPPVAICANEPLQFDHGATDLEGDSLVYEFCSPLKGGSVDDLAPDPDTNQPYEAVDFITPTYTAQTPLGGDPMVSIDPQTGVISGTPTTLGQFVVGICVKEYRRGRLLGSIQRDFQFNVVSCEIDVVAALDGSTKEGKDYFYEICEGDTLRIINQSYQQANIQGYEWKFRAGDELINTTDVNLLLEDLEVGNYKGQMIVNPESTCSDTAFITVAVHENPTAKLTFEYDTCFAGPVQFYSYVLSNTNPVESYYWNFGDGMESTEILPTHQYERRGAYDVTLSIEDEKGCVGRHIEEVNWQPQPEVPFEPPLPAEGCAPFLVNFNHLENLVDSTYDVTWEFGDGTTEDAVSVSHTYEQPGEYDIEMSIVSEVGCEISETFPAWVVVEDPPVAKFSYLPEGVNKREAVQFENLSKDYGKSLWSFGEMDSSTEVNPVYTFEATGSYKVRLEVENHLGCVDTTSQLIDVRAVHRIYIPNAFSPNEDDANDKFRAYVYCPLQDFEMKIFDRWGQQIFESHDVETGWDGLKNNEVFEPGVYVWMVSFLADGSKQVLSGDVTLVE